jgi:hypothetical protein
MKTARLLLAMSLFSMLVGCTRLPEINAKLVRYDSSYPIGGTTIVIKDVEVTPTEVKAGEYSRTTKLWGFSQGVHIEGYVRERTPADAAPSRPVASPLAP